MGYRERLSTPLAWWVLSGLFAISLLLAFGFYLGPAWGIAVGLASFVAAGAVFWAASIQIELTATRFSVGRASIELTYLGAATPLDPQQARLRRGPAADARAFLVLRPYVSTAVEVTLTDPDDPAPYWLVASRRPRELAAALTSAIARATGAPTSTDPAATQ
jgi:Protein of unknown function (DUF3093)